MADNSVEYALVRITREDLEKMRDDGKHGGRQAVAGYPYYCCAESGEIEVYPDMIGGRLEIRGDQVFYVPAPKADPFKATWEDFRKGLLADIAAHNAKYAEAETAVDAAQRKEHPAQMPDEVVDELFNDQDVPCNICGQRGLHACEPPPAPTIFNRIVSMVEFKGRLYVATECGVFAKGDDDIFRELEFEPFSIAAAVKAGHDADKARAADEAAGLVPLHPRQTAERADPFVPNKFGEHG